MPKAFEALEEIRQTGSQKHFTEFKVKKKNGDFAWVETDGSLIYRDKKPYAILSVARDITMRKKSEEALRQSEAQFRTAIESLPFDFFMLDKNGRYVLQNTVCKANWGDVIGKRPEDLTQDKRTISVWQNNNRRALNGDVVRGEVEYIIAGEKRHYYNIISPIRDENDILGILGVDIDISDLKETECALRESEERFRNMAELLPETVFEADLSGNLTFVNRKAYDYLGYTQQDFERGLNCFDMISADDRERAFENIGRILKGENIGLNEYTALKKDGSTFPIMIHSSPILRGDQLMGVRGFIIDISDRKRAEKEKTKLEIQFYQAQRLETLGTLAGGIAHDFNNLLMTIQGNTSLMIFDVETAHPHYSLLKNIEEQIEKGAKLTRQLLGYARKGKYNVKPMDLNQIIAESSDTFSRTRKELTIQRRFETNLSAIEADQGQIEQILYNLYVNAADAMPDGGELILETANVTHQDINGHQYDPKPGEYVRLSVKDTGVGIDKEHQARIFDPFFTTKEMGRGTGLGLASAYGIVKSHEGYIEVESEKDIGTTFHIYLPASDKAVQPLPKIPAKIVAGSGTVLLVDDEEVVLNVGAKVLEKMGYTVFPAQSGVEAIDIFHQKKAQIDLVILDVIMPDIGGGEAYDKIKEIDSSAKVLLSSGYSIDGQAAEIMNRGCDGFIQKPFNANDLSAKLTQLLGDK
jgi:PAS domain S-box-containing protein